MLSFLVYYGFQAKQLCFCVSKQRAWQSRLMRKSQSLTTEVANSSVQEVPFGTILEKIVVNTPLGNIFVN